MLTIHNFLGTVGADFDALAAADTLIGVVHQHGLHADGLRIMAPGAVHVTALEEDGGTDTGTVI